MVVQRVADLADQVEPKDSGGRGRDLIDNLLSGRGVDPGREKGDTVAWREKGDTVA